MYSSIILHDIVERFEIRNIGLFNRITKFLVENIGNLISAHSVYTYLKHDLKITKLTIYLICATIPRPIRSGMNCTKNESGMKYCSNAL